VKTARCLKGADGGQFNAPIYANLFRDEDGDSYTLIWSRPRKNGD
jgi:uncharacterized protein (DUF736 family)